MEDSKTNSNGKCEEKWQVLKFDSDYEINTDYPYQIRRIGSDRIIKEPIGRKYIQININGRSQYKHRLIALQFIENDDPDHKTEVDHINRNKHDNNLSNLRWCTRGENNKNKDTYTKRKYEYVEEIPINAIQICDYEDIKLDRYFYDFENENLYMETKTIDVKYRIIKPRLVNGLLTIDFVDVNGKTYSRSHTKFINHMRTIL